MNIKRLFKRFGSQVSVDDLIGFVYVQDFKKIKSNIKNKDDANVRDEDGRTLLMHAALDTEHNLNLIRLLIDLGIDVNAPDNQNWTALHFACQDQKTDIINVLLENNAKVNGINANGSSPVLLAVKNGKCNNSLNILVRLLLNYGADPYKKNNNGISAYNIAENRQDMVLLELFEKYQK